MTATTEIAHAIAGRQPGCVRYPEWRTRWADGAAIARVQNLAADAVTWVADRVPAGGGLVVRR